MDFDVDTIRHIIRIAILVCLLLLIRTRRQSISMRSWRRFRRHGKSAGASPTGESRFDSRSLSRFGRDNRPRR